MKLLFLIFALLIPVSLKAACAPPSVEAMEEKLKTSEAGAKTSPKSDEAKLELASSLSGTAGVLLRRKKPGDIEKAIVHANRALKIAEEVLKATPPPEKAYLVTWGCLNTLGGILEARGQPGDKEKALDYRLRAVTIAEAQYKGDINSPPRYNMLSNTYYAMISYYGKRGAAGDDAIAYEYGVKVFKLQEAVLKAEDSNRTAPLAIRTTPSTLAIIAISNAGLAEKAQKPEAKQWTDRAYEIYFTAEKNGYDLTPQDKTLFAELKKKLGK